MANKKPKPRSNQKPRPKPRPSQTLPAGGPRGAAPGGGRKPTQTERIEAARRARRRAQTRNRVILWGALAVVVAAVAVVVVNNRRQAAAVRDELTAGSCTLDSRADRTDPSPNNHVASPRYAVDPPAGGNHLAQPAEPGVYRGPSVPPDGQLVHSLEHGYVILWHTPALPEATVRKIDAVAEKYERDTLVVERASLEGEVAATAWGKRLLCDSVEPERLGRFIEEYRNKGPEKIPR